MSAVEFVRSGSAQLAISRFGSGSPTVVLLHPAVADRRCWTVVAEQLASLAHVITYDQRGFGETTYAPEPHRPADDLAAVLDAHGADQIVLVGNSRGGRIATEFALDAPERVSTLVLIGAAIAGAPQPATLSPDLEAMFEAVDRLEAAGDLDAVNAIEARIWLDGPSRPEGAVGGHARDLFLAMNGRALRAEPTGDELASDDPTAWDRLGALTMPVHAVVGEHDLPHVIERMRFVADRVQRATFTMIANAAHAPQLDEPNALLATLHDVLTSMTT